MNRKFVWLIVAAMPFISSTEINASVEIEPPSDASNEESKAEFKETKSNRNLRGSPQELSSIDQDAIPQSNGSFKEAMEGPEPSQEMRMRNGGETSEQDGYPLGTDLNSVLTRPTLDFTDNLKEIVKRVLVMRKNMKKSKQQYFDANNMHISTGSNYKVYNNHGYLDRPEYLPEYINNRTKPEERRLLDQNKKHDEYLKYMSQQEFERSGFQKTLNEFNYRDIYKLSKKDLLGSRAYRKKLKLEL